MPPSMTGSAASRRPSRPERLQLADFAGRFVSLAEGPESWRRLKAGAKGKLLLGLGPLPGKAPICGPLFWCEAPQTLNQLQSIKGPLVLPRDWQEIDATRIPSLGNDCEVWFYSANLKLAPDFWGPILAQIALANSQKPQPAPDFVWLPGNASQLLHNDLLAALANAGFHACQAMPAQPDIDALMDIWGGKSPAFALSVNFRGLDPEGRIFELCRELNIPLAIWLVDNPWNILSGISLPWWKQATLFTTDASFVQPLHDSGAKHTYFLPLAASEIMLDSPMPAQTDLPPVFVGSSAFSERQKFFSGLTIEPALYEKAVSKLNGRQLPDFHWWQKQIMAKPWPGREIRAASLGCDECSTLRRAQWLREAMQSGLEVIGDAGWKRYLPAAILKPPVDYYSQLPLLYASSECVLNITSLLLPNSLNQRHFDVWAAGGFLFTDATPGLAIFPEELTAPVMIASAAEFRARRAWLEENPAAKRDLAASWRELIAKEHTYSNRLAEICARVNVPWPAP